MKFLMLMLSLVSYAKSSRAAVPVKLNIIHVSEIYNSSNVEAAVEVSQNSNLMRGNWARVIFQASNASKYANFYSVYITCKDSNYKTVAKRDAFTQYSLSPDMVTEIIAYIDAIPEQLDKAECTLDLRGTGESSGEGTANFIISK